MNSQRGGQWCGKETDLSHMPLWIFKFFALLTYHLIKRIRIASFLLLIDDLETFKVPLALGLLLLLFAMSFD